MYDLISKASHLLLGFGGHKNAAGGKSYLTMQETLRKFEEILEEYEIWGFRGNRQKALGIRQYAKGIRQKAIGIRQKAIGKRQKAIGKRLEIRD